MFKTRSQLKIENRQYENRVNELENILCPNGHDWVEIDRKVLYDNLAIQDVIAETTLQCRRCKMLLVRKDGNELYFTHSSKRGKKR